MQEVLNQCFNNCIWDNILTHCIWDNIFAPPRVKFFGSPAELLATRGLTDSSWRGRMWNLWNRTSLQTVDPLLLPCKYSIHASRFLSLEVIFSMWNIMIFPSGRLVSIRHRPITHICARAVTVYFPTAFAEIHTFDDFISSDQYTQQSLLHSHNYFDKNFVFVFFILTSVNICNTCGIQQP